MRLFVYKPLCALAAAVLAIGTAAAQPTGPPLEPELFVHSHFNGKRLREPVVIFYDRKADELFVADSGNRLIGIFDPAGMPKFSFGSESGLQQPLGVMTDTRGRIYVRVGGGPLVQVFSYRGELLGMFPFADADGPIEEVSIATMTSSPDGRLLFAEGKSGRVLIYDEDWNFLLAFGHKGQGRGALYYPMGLAVGPRGEIFVSDSQGIVVQVFSADGRLQRGWGEREMGAENFSTPAGIAVDDDGRVYVADTLRQDIKVFDSRGAFLFHFGGYGDRPGNVAYPRDVEVSPDGRVWVCEKIGHRVQVFRPRTAEEAREPAADQ